MTSTRKFDIVWYKANGEQIIVTPQVYRNYFTLDELHQFVGGSIAIVSLGSKDNPPPFFGEDHHGFFRGGLVRDGWILVLNDEGRIRGLPTNEAASELWGARLVGDVLLCPKSYVR
jgi:hypothetical protein